MARAAASVGLPMVLSTASSRTIEEVAEALGDNPRWFQLYWPKGILSAEEARRAVEAGMDVCVGSRGGG